MRIYYGEGRAVEINFISVKIKSLFRGWILYGFGDKSGEWFFGYSRRIHD